MQYDDLIHLLNDRLEREVLQANDIAEAARACFVVCQYDFVKARQPERPYSEVVAFTNELVDEVFTELGLNTQHPTMATLEHAIEVLDNRFEFMQDPVLAEHHHEIIDALLSKANPKAD